MYNSFFFPLFLFALEDETLTSGRLSLLEQETDGSVWLDEGNGDHRFEKVESFGKADADTHGDDDDDGGSDADWKELVWRNERIAENIMTDNDDKIIVIYEGIEKKELEAIKLGK